MLLQQGRWKKKDRLDLKVFRAAKVFTIFHVNIMSLLPHWDELNESIFNCDLDVIIFTETRLHDKISDALIKLLPIQIII